MLQYAGCTNLFIIFFVFIKTFQISFFKEASVLIFQVILYNF